MTIANPKIDFIFTIIKYKRTATNINRKNFILSYLFNQIEPLVKELKDYQYKKKLTYQQPENTV